MLSTVSFCQNPILFATFFFFPFFSIYVSGRITTERWSRQNLSKNRVQTDPGKPGKPGKTINFQKNQGNLGKSREIFFFSHYSGKLREFFLSRLRL